MNRQTDVLIDILNNGDSLTVDLLRKHKAMYGGFITGESLREIMFEDFKHIPNGILQDLVFELFSEIDWKTVSKNLLTYTTSH